MSAKRAWKDYLAERTEAEIRNIAEVAIAELINADSVRFRERDDDPEFGCEEELYWESCGDSLLGE